VNGFERKQLIEACVREAADYYFVAPADVTSRSRNKSAAAARAMAMALLRRRSSWSFPEIGLVFGRDHTTVIHAVRKAERELSDRLGWSPPAQPAAGGADVSSLLLMKPATEETLEQWEERMGFSGSKEVA
jgi:hypothetical protein